MNQQAKRFYEFGRFRIDLTERLLFRDGLSTPLTPKVFDTLLAFVENSGRILGKDEAMKLVWPDTTVEEANLTRNVSVLRKTLGETPDQRQYIETIPWRGYRFVASVREVWEEIKEQSPTTAVIIEQELGAPDQRAEFSLTAPDNSHHQEIKEREWNRRPAQVLTAACAALIAVLLAISFLGMLKLTAEEGGRANKRATKSAEAQRAYLKGRFWWNKRSKEGFQRAIEFYQEAISLDRNYALPYAGLADCYILMSPFDLTSRMENYPKARAAATQALALDHQLAEAHASLAHISWLYDWNFPVAELEFKQAILSDPNYATAHQWYSVYLSSMERHNEAIAEAKLARELEPLSISIIQDISRAYYHAKRYDEAIATSLEALDLNPQYCQLNSWTELAYAQKGLFDRAIETRLSALTAIDTDPKTVASLRRAYATSGWEGYWRKELESETAKPSHGPAFSYLMARLYTRIGENERALGWLEKTYQERMDHLVLLRVDPVFDPLRKDPRFDDLLQRVGLERTDQALPQHKLSNSSLNALKLFSLPRFDPYE